jgi:hypothetical protein
MRYEVFRVTSYFIAINAFALVIDQVIHCDRKRLTVP